MRKGSDFVALIVVTILFSYAMTIGATFNGLLTVELHPFTFGLMGLTAAGWLVIHWRRGWVWHRSPLDGVFVLWAIAFGVSTLANLESWRRIAIGLWYVGVYIGIWYMLADAISNRGIKRETVIEGLLICGVVVLIFGYIQSRVWFTSTVSLIVSGVVPFSLPRPVSTFGNPNTLANFLVVLIPFALAKAVSARQSIGRVVLGVYTLLAILLLLLTFSRGGWIGVAAGIGAWILLVLAQHDMVSSHRFRAWWAARSPVGKRTAVVISGAAVVVSFTVLLLFVRSFEIGGRTTRLRTGIWNDAVTLFSEQPLTGSGLFTFGSGLSRLYSTPPNTPHSHAHNAPLHIAAEFGIPGLIALAATLVVMGLAVRKNWRAMDNRQRGLLAGSVGAVVGFAAHQLTDIPATAPAIALSGLVALALMMLPVEPIPLASAFRRLGHPAAMAGLWAVLLATGLWSSGVYEQYVAILNYSLETGDYRGGAEQLQAVVDRDPVSIYKKEQGLLWGLAANEGDVEAARQGIAVYQQFIATDPDYAIVWANMAALYWQLGEAEAGGEAMQRAVELSPLSWQLAVNLGDYEAAMGNEAAAQAAYDQAVRLYPDSILMPGLERLAALDEENRLSIPARVVSLLDNGQIEQAKTIWSEHPQPGSSGKYAIDAILALAEGNREAAEAALIYAEQIATSEAEGAWVMIGLARLARFDGDDGAAEMWLNEARVNLARAVFEGDYVDGLSIAYAHFLRRGFSRQFIPQVYYPVDDPVQLHLLENT